jgi:cytochrome c5
MVDFGGTLINDEVKDYGLDDLVTNDDIEAYNSMIKPSSGGPIDPLSLSTMMLTGLVQLDREVRVAGTVFNASNYAGANQATLSGTSQWSDYVNSNPLSALLTAIDAVLVRPNTIVLGQAGWTALRQHPKMVQAVYKSAQNAGSIPREALAELLEIENVVIGAAFVNTARKGQTPSYQRTWGKHCSLLHVSREAAQMGQPTWGFAAQWGTRIAGNIPLPTSGLRGGQRVRSGESRKEVVSAPDAG